jgi:hypothetical protein
VALSSHCASSTTHSSGRSSAVAESRPSAASATRKRSGVSPAARAERDAQGRPLVLGDRVEPVEHRGAELVQAREGQLHLRLDALDLGEAELGRRRVT